MVPGMAGPIIEARKAGKRPALMVIVADGPEALAATKGLNPVVVINPMQPLRSYDFKFLANLDVEIATSGDGRRTTALINALLKFQPRTLQVHWLDDDSVLSVLYDGEIYMVHLPCTCGSGHARH